MSCIQTCTEVLVYKPSRDTVVPNPKLVLPWGGPYVICSQLFPVVYRVMRTKETREAPVLLAHIKRSHPREKPPAPQFDELANLFRESKSHYVR